MRGCLAACVPRPPPHPTGLLRRPPRPQPHLQPPSRPAQPPARSTPEKAWAPPAGLLYTTQVRVSWCAPGARRSPAATPLWNSGQAVCSAKAPLPAESSTERAVAHPRRGQLAAATPAGKNHMHGRPTALSWAGKATSLSAPAAGAAAEKSRFTTALFCSGSRPAAEAGLGWGGGAEARPGGAAA